MPGKPRRRNDVMWCMNEERLNALANLLGRETLREQMKRNQECSLRTPVSEMKRNLIGMENLVITGILRRKSRRDGRSDASRQRRRIQRSRSVTGQLSEDSLNLFTN